MSWNVHSSISSCICISHSLLVNNHSYYISHHIHTFPTTICKSAHHIYKSPAAFIYLSLHATVLLSPLYTQKLIGTMTVHDNDIHLRVPLIGGASVPKILMQKLPQGRLVFKLQLRVVLKIKAPYFTTFLNALGRTFINLLMHLHITQFTCK